MRFRTSTAVAVCVFAVGLGAVGCSSASSSSSSAGSATPAGPATTGAGAATQAGTTQAGTGTSASASASAQQAMSPPASSQPAQAVANTSKCQAADLSFALGAGHQVEQDQWTQAVDMTNKSSSPCTMQGFPGVDLIGDTTGQANDDWTLTDSSATGAKVTLQPGATAHFDLTYLNGDLASGGGGGNVMSVQRMVITAPDDPNVNSDADVQGNLPWAATVVFQQAATHPGTYVVPVASGS